MDAGAEILRPAFCPPRTSAWDDANPTRTGQHGRGNSLTRFLSVHDSVVDDKYPIYPGLMAREAGLCISLVVVTRQKAPRLSAES